MSKWGGGEETNTHFEKYYPPPYSLHFPITIRIFKSFSIWKLHFTTKKTVVLHILIAYVYKI